MLRVVPVAAESGLNRFNGRLFYFRSSKRDYEMYSKALEVNQTPAV